MCNVFTAEVQAIVMIGTHKRMIHSHGGPEQLHWYKYSPAIYNNSSLLDDVLQLNYSALLL
jgi:hypothetical protein